MHAVGSLNQYTQLGIPYFLDFFLRVLLISGPARMRVQFEGGNKTRAGSISLGSACSLECLRASALLRYDVLVAANNEISAAASAATLPGFAVH